MSIVVIPASDGVQVTAQIQLVDAWNRPVVGVEIGGGIISTLQNDDLSEDWSVELTPTSKIAINSAGATWYLLTIRAPDRMGWFRFQVPESVDPLTLEALVGADELTPGNPLSQYLLTSAERAAMTAANAPAADNPFATLMDLESAGFAGAWQDLPGPVTAIPIQGRQGDPDVDLDGSLLFDPSAVEQVAQVYQFKHGTVFDVPAHPHVHWMKTTDAAGDVVWEMRHRTWRVGTVPSPWSDWVPAAGRSEAVAGDQREIIDFWSVDISHLADSAHLNCQFRRKADDASDTYASDIRAWSFDAHTFLSSLGSVEEFPEI